MDPVTGNIELGDPAHPEMDDVLDDVGMSALKLGGEVVMVPSGMPEKNPRRGTLLHLFPIVDLALAALERYASSPGGRRHEDRDHHL